MFGFACDLTLATSAYKDAAMTHLFYQNNRMHDKLDVLGFTATVHKFQTDNFGRGGLKNLVEFAFNTDPTSPSPAALPTVTTALNPTDNKHYLTFTYRRRITPGSMTCDIQTSHDLVTWTTIPVAYLEQVGAATATGDGVTEFVTFRVPPAIEDDPTPCFVHMAVSP